MFTIPRVIPHQLNTSGKISNGPCHIRDEMIAVRQILNPIEIEIEVPRGEDPRMDRLVWRAQIEAAEPH